MRISSRSRYGMQAMLALALRNDPSPLSVKEIAERYALPEHYLEQLITPLRRAGLVQSARGAQGGYVLSRAAEDIALLDIVEALDGEIPLESCRCPEDSPHALGFCLEHALWRKLKREVEEYLAGRTLAQLRDEARHADQEASPAYDI